MNLAQPLRHRHHGDSAGSVPTRQGETEAVSETSHVEPVQVPGLISAVMPDLNLRRQTGKHAIENLPLAEPIGGVTGGAPLPPRAPPPTRSFSVQSDGV